MFLYRLAAQLGIADVAQMAASLTPEQVDGWIAYDAAEPLGLRGVVRQLCDLLGMVAAYAGADSKPSEFYPGVKPPERTQSEKEQQAAMRAAAGRVG